MKKTSTLTILILAVCAFCLVLMRTCGGAEKPPTPTFTPAPVTAPPTETPVIETPTPVIQNTPEPVEISLWTTDGVNLRRTPDTSAEKMSVIPKGEKVLRLDYPANNWVKVKYNELEGYVSCDFVTQIDPNAGSNAPSASPSATLTNNDFVVTPCNDVVYATDGVNLRRGPGKEYDVAVSVNKDTRLERTGTTANGWSRVLYNSVGYFVSSEFVTTTAPASVQTATPTAIPSPTPTASVDPAQTTANSSGEFSSNTGVPLNVVASYSTTPNGDGTYTLTVSAVLRSHALTAAQYADNLCFSIGEDTFYKTSPAINITGEEQTDTPLGSQSAKVKAGSVPVSVSWTFNGSYSGKNIDKITASTTLYISAS